MGEKVWDASGMSAFHPTADVNRQKADMDMGISEVG